VEAYNEKVLACCCRGPDIDGHAAGRGFCSKWWFPRGWIWRWWLPRCCHGWRLPRCCYRGWLPKCCYRGWLPRCCYQPRLSQRRHRSRLSQRCVWTTLSHRRVRTRLSAPRLWLWVSVRSRRGIRSRGELSLLLFVLLLGPMRRFGPLLWLGECLSLFLLLLRCAGPADVGRGAALINSGPASAGPFLSAPFPRFPRHNQAGQSKRAPAGNLSKHLWQVWADQVAAIREPGGIPLRAVTVEHFSPLLPPTTCCGVAALRRLSPSTRRRMSLT
jgi:hypothetical protein